MYSSHSIKPKSPADIQILALLGLLLFCLRKKRRQRQANRDSASSFAAGEHADHGGKGGGVFGSIFPNRNSGQPNISNSSEKGLIGRHGAAAASTPTMGGDTLYSHNKSMEGMGSGAGSSGAGAGAGAATGLGLGAAAGAFAAGTGPGMRNSGVVLPRVKDENQSGDRWIETGAEVSVLWP
jgi:hypothetical protein